MISLSGISFAIITLFMFSEASIGGIFYQPRFKSSTFCQTWCLYKNVVISRWYTLEFPFSLGSLYLLKYCKMFMVHEILVLSYLVVSHKQLLIQHDAMNKKVGCHLGVIKLVRNKKNGKTFFCLILLNGACTTTKHCLPKDHGK